MGTKGWHRRGYLPHYDGYDISQHVVFRLFDSIPPNEQEGDDVLDRHLGAAFMRDTGCARIVAEALLHGDGNRYVLQAWCVMPNHVHALIATNAERTWPNRPRLEAFHDTAHQRTPSTNRASWAKDYFDRFVRDDRHFETTKAYIENNPVVAGLCDTPADWPFSSAGWRSET
jgi:REP element-mobilizing transposase RayT